MALNPGLAILTILTVELRAQTSDIDEDEDEKLLVEHLIEALNPNYMRLNVWCI